jgi:predicted DNA-binding transcriptional regulator AlpA
MDAQTTNRIHAAPEIFRRLEEDPEGAIRGMVHVLGDLAMDRAFHRIRGGPVTRQEPVPSATPPALLAASTNTDHDSVVVQDRITTLEAENKDLHTRVETLIAQNHAFEDTIARMRREAEVRRSGRSEPRETKQEQEKTAALDTAIEYEDGVGHPQSDTATIDTPEICTLLGIKSSCFYAIRHRHKDFPKSIGKRHKVHIFRRGEVDDWITTHRTPHLDSDRIEKDGLIDAIAIAKRLSCKVSSIWFWRKNKNFPREATRMGQRCYWRKEDVDTWAAAHQQGPGAGQRRAKTAKITVGDITECSNCADCHTVGRIAICRSDGSPRRNQSVQPSETCDWHKKPGNYRPVRAEDEGD